MASQTNGLNFLHTFIIEEMRKKEKVLEQVLDQTKSIRRGFESFQKNMESKSQEISVLRKSVTEMRGEMDILKSQVEEVAGMRSNVQKLKQELIKMKILQKLSQERDRESASEESLGLLEWHRNLETQHRQQKFCKACRKEAKQRYKAHKSQEW